MVLAEKGKGRREKSRKKRTIIYYVGKEKRKGRVRSKSHNTNHYLDVEKCSTSSS